LLFDACSLFVFGASSITRFVHGSIDIGLVDAVTVNQRQQMPGPAAGSQFVAKNSGTRGQFSAADSGDTANCNKHQESGEAAHLNANSAR
jgi:hypothetical protein